MPNDESQYRKTSFREQMGSNAFLKLCREGLYSNTAVAVYCMRQSEKRQAHSILLFFVKVLPSRQRKTAAVMANIPRRGEA
jgi:hypothetical protein